METEAYLLSQRQAVTVPGRSNLSALNICPDPSPTSDCFLAATEHNDYCELIGLSATEGELVLSPLHRSRGQK